MTTRNDTIPTPAAATDADARLIARWAYIGDHGDYDADGPFTPADYDRLAAIYANDARELAVVLDCRGLDYPPTATNDDDDPYCVACQGTGIGAADGPCCECNGCGIEGGPWRSARYGYADDDDAEVAA